MNKKYGALSSSQDSQKLALTVKGVLVGFIPLAIWLGGKYGLSVTETSAMEAIEAMTAMIAGCMTLWGLYRKTRV